MDVELVETGVLAGDGEADVFVVDAHFEAHRGRYKDYVAALVEEGEDFGAERAAAGHEGCGCGAAGAPGGEDGC